MKKWLARFFLSMTALASSLLYLHAALAAESPASMLNGLLKPLRSLQADFIQTVVDLHGNQLDRAKGKIWLDRPGKFRLETRGSETQLIVADGKNIRVYDADLQQMTIRPMRSLGREVPALLLSEQDVFSEKNFTVSRLATGKHADRTTLAFLLVPKDRDSSLSGVSLEFTRGVLSVMQFSNYLDQTTTLRFSHVKTGLTLPAKLFRFVPPKGTDIVNAPA